MKNNDVDKQMQYQQHANVITCEYEQAKSKFSYFQQIFIFYRFHAFFMTQQEAILAAIVVAIVDQHIGTLAQI